MRQARRIFTRLGVALAMSVSSVFVGLAAPHDGHAHGGAQHGGTEAKSKRHHFEVVFTKAGLTLYAHGPEQKPLDVSRLKASATFYHPSVSVHTPGTLQNKGFADKHSSQGPR